jgi:hypothetical protein
VTAPVKAWRGPNAIPADAWCRVQIYVIWGEDPWERGKGNACYWVGESARFPLARLGDHFTDKYWRHGIRRIDVLPEVYSSKAAAWKAEERLTHELLPVFPTEYNQANPWRISNGRGVHRPLPRIPAHWTLGRIESPPARSKLAAWWASWRWLVAVLAMMWLALFVVGCWQSARWLDGWDVALAGLVAAFTPFVVGLWLWARLRRRRPRRRGARVG